MGNDKPKEAARLLWSAMQRHADEAKSGLPTTKEGVEAEMRRILGASKMRKAEKKRQDAEPEVTYDEPVAMIYDVGSSLKAVSKALKRQIKRQTAMTPSTRQVSGELRNIEKRVRRLPGCC